MRSIEKRCGTKHRHEYRTSTQENSVIARRSCTTRDIPSRKLMRIFPSENKNCRGIDSSRAASRYSPSAFYHRVPCYNECSGCVSAIGRNWKVASNFYRIKELIASILSFQRMKRGKEEEMEEILRRKYFLKPSEFRTGSMFHLKTRYCFEDIITIFCLFLRELNKFQRKGNPRRGQLDQRQFQSLSRHKCQTSERKRKIYFSPGRVLLPFGRGRPARFNLYALALPLSLAPLACSPSTLARLRIKLPVKFLVLAAHFSKSTDRSTCASFKRPRYYHR